jgi:hypothetical protein
MRSYRTTVPMLEKAMRGRTITRCTDRGGTQSSRDLRHDDCAPIAGPSTGEVRECYGIVYRGKSIVKTQPEPAMS